MSVSGYRVGVSADARVSDLPPPAHPLDHSATVTMTYGGELGDTTVLHHLGPDRRRPVYRNT